MTHPGVAPTAGPANRLRRRAGRLSGRLPVRLFVRMLAALALAIGLHGASRAQDEVPFITTPDPVTLAMLQLAGVRSTDFVVDLGSGDGRIVITAARRFGARGLGVEIDPTLVARSRDNARAAGVADRVEFRVQDLFQTDLSVAQVVTLYLLPEVNLQLRPRLLAMAPGTRIVSHDWDMGDWQPDRRLTLDVPEKAIGRDKRSTVYLWLVPAQVQGMWCTAGGSLAITQRFQTFSATLSANVDREGDQDRDRDRDRAGDRAGDRDGAAEPVLVFDGQVTADRLHAGSAAAAVPISLRVVGDALQLEQAPNVARRFVGRRFTRAGAPGCF